ncbi:hypothetical protein ACP4OV_024243 [Aristida adscensionis]
MERPVAKHEAAAPAAPARQQLPPGFRFHPTDEELVVQYLRRKALSRPLPAAVIPVVHDAAGLDPWDLPGAAEGEGYFFSLRRPPAAGGRRKRRAGSGYWQVTGKEKPVFLQCGSGGGGGKRHLLVGVKTALTFHGGSPSGTRWLMHEYRLAAPGGVAEQSKNASHDQLLHHHPAPAEWVVCRISLRNTSGRPGRRHAGDGGAPGCRHRRRRREEDDGRHQQRPLLLLSSPPSPSPSSSSCVTGVTDIADQEEVSSGSSSRGAPGAASQREA